MANNFIHSALANRAGNGNPHTGAPSQTTHSPAQERRYLILLALVMVLLSAIYPLLSESLYKGSADVHATIEMLSALFGLVTGLALIVRFYILGDRFYLFIGLAFFVNGTEDLIHGLLSFNPLLEVVGLPASSLEQFIPGTYVTGRMLMGVILLLAASAPRWLGKSRDPRRETRWTLLAVLLIAMLATAVAFQLPLPTFIYPDRFISRPVDFLSAIVLLVALLAFLAEYHRRRDVLTWWILLSIAVNSVGQVQMSFSKALYDPFFEIAHVYKVLGYVVPLLGFSFYQIAIITERLRAEEENARLYEQTRVALAQTEALYRAGRSLSAIESLPDVLQTVVDSVAASLHADRVTLITFDKAQVGQFVKGGPGADKVVLVSFDELWDGLSGWVLRESPPRPALSPKGILDPRESLQVQQRRVETDCGAIVVVPVRYQDQTLGTLTAINRQDERDFTEQDAELLAAMANQAAIAIEKARLFQALQKSRGELEARVEKRTAELSSANVELQKEVAKRRQVAALLRESEERYRSLFENASDLIHGVGPDGRFLFVNRAWLETLGYTEAELPGLNSFDIIHPESLSHCQERFSRAFEGASTRDFQTTLVTKDGRPLSVEGNMVGHRIDGQVVATFVFLHDVTKRVRAEQALKRRNLLLETLNELSQAVSVTLEISPILNAVARIAAQAIDATSAYVCDWDEERGMSTVLAEYYGPGAVDLERVSDLGATYDEVDEFGERVEWLRDAGGYYVRHIDDAELDPKERAHMEQYGAKSILVVPLVTKGRSIGYLELWQSRYKQGFTPDEIEIIWAIAQQVAVTIDNVWLHASLRESEQQYRSLVETMNDGLVVQDTNGLITYANDAFDKMLGYSPGETIGAPISKFLDETNLAIVVKKDLARATGAKESYEAELTGKEDKVPALISAAPLFDNNGNLAGSFGVFTDITERKREEEAIKQRAAQLALLNDIGGRIAAVLELNLVMDQVVRLVQESFDYHHVALFTLNQEETMLVMRARAGIYDTLYPPDHQLALGQGIVGWVGQHGKTRLTNDVELEPHYVNLYPGVIPTRSELSVPIQIGKIVVGVLDIQSPQRNTFDENDVLVMETLADQVAVALMNAQLYEKLDTERANLARRVEERTTALSAVNAELARAARLKDEFLASMSHELRTPLNAILGLSGALQEQVYGPLNEDQLESLHDIEDSGHHLLAMINDILDVAKIEAGKVELEIGAVSVEPVGQASLRLIKQLAHEKRLQVSSSFDSAVTTLQADERRLKQILVNLLNNAIKFTPQGGEIGLEVKGDAEGEAVHLTVWDTGIGIAPEDMERLFQPFVQLDSSLSRQHGGTGLGLALVSRLAEMHGGSISVESAVGQGSRFTVSLPWRLTDQGRMTDDKELVEESPGAPILRQALIKDSPSAAAQLARYLNELGAETVIHPQGEGTVEKALALQPDVIILDILLPDLPGWDVLTQLKAEPRTQDIPVLIVSVVDERARGLALVAAGYLVKPVTRQRLKRALGKILPGQVEEARALIVASDQDLPGEQAPDRAPLILLAEDNETNIKTVSDYLLFKGYWVIVARDGNEAIVRAQDERPDLILMDIQMPGMDGLEATRRIRSFPHEGDTEGERGLADVPIIALTALAMPGDRGRCLEAGANEYLSKPVAMKRLLKEIEALLR